MLSQCSPNYLDQDQILSTICCASYAIPKKKNKRRKDAMALAAAPYLHAKLASHTISSDPNPLRIVHGVQVVTVDSREDWEKVNADRRLLDLSPSSEAGEV